MAFLNFYTAASADDANEVVATGVVDITGDGQTALVSNLDGTNHGGFRFVNVTLDPSAQILEARVFFEQLHNYSGFGNMGTSTWYMEAADNAAQFAATANNISTRVRTSWGLSGADAGTFWTSSGHEFTDAVREILARPGWVSGNAMVALCIGNGTAGNYIRPYMWDYFSGNYRARLRIRTPDPDLSFKTKLRRLRPAVFAPGRAR